MRTCNRPGCSFPVFGGGYCKTHQYVRKDKKKKSIRQYSKKRTKENRKYSTLRKQFLEGKECEARLEGCTGVATDVHHTEGRIGERFLDVITWKGLCRNCHQIVENNPALAKRLKLSKSRLS